VFRQGATFSDLVKTTHVTDVTNVGAVLVADADGCEPR